MGPIVCTETSINDYRSALRNIAEQQRRHLNLRVSVDPCLPTQFSWILQPVCSALRDVGVRLFLWPLPGRGSV